MSPPPPNTSEPSWVSWAFFRPGRANFGSICIHDIVSGAGLRADGLRWIRGKDPDYFLPEKVLARRFRTRLRLALQQSPELFSQIPAEVWQQGWVVDIVAVGSGVPALKYLANYVYKTAFASQRILADDGHQITFSYKDSKDGQRKQNIYLCKPCDQYHCG